MKRLALIVLLCLLAELVFAAPVYLDCTVASEDGEQTDFSLMVNEETGEISKRDKSGNPDEIDVEGSFAPNEINFSKLRQYIDRPLVTTIRDSYVLDRTDLSITKKQFKTIMDFVNSGKAKDLISEETMSNGFCSVVEVKGRKI